MRKGAAATVKRNKGVEERARRDERQAAEEDKSIDASAAKLRQKSQLYERLGMVSMAVRIIIFKYLLARIL